MSGFIIAIASGKGGTGKTTVAVNLAKIFGDANLLDCDVEEPNAHLFLKPQIHERKPVYLPTPQVDESLCSYCGMCATVCAYHAILVGKNVVLTFPELCHGCGGCAVFCPEGAIKEVDRELGFVEMGKAGDIQFTHGILNVGEPMAGPVIRAVKKNISMERINIIDAPPGAACPMIESVRDADFLILVTEPTPFGLNDLKIAVEAARLLDLPCGIVINRAGIGNNEVRDYAVSENIELLAEIPDDRRVAEIYSRGGIIVDEHEEFKRRFSDLAGKLKSLKKPDELKKVAS